jgi:histidinol-phosphate aminotransferase
LAETYKEQSEKIYRKLDMTMFPVPENILSIHPYSPGKPLEELEREYGIANSVKLASNENPLGPSPMAIEAVRKALPNVHRYPDGSGFYLVKKLAERLSVSPANIVLGNGSDEIIGMLTNALLRPRDEVILPTPSFLMYDIMVKCAGAVSVYVPLVSQAIDLAGLEKHVTSRTRMVFITNPNNPTGTIVLKDDFERFLGNIPADVVVVVDEAYIEFVRDSRCAYSHEFFGAGPPLVSLRTFSKAYGLAGLRIGYGVMPEELSNILNRVRQPFNANALAQVAAAAALDDRDFLEKTVRLIHGELDYLFTGLEKRGLQCFPTQTNFFLLDVKENADEIFEKLLQNGVIVRSMSSYGYPEFIRVTVGLHEENVKFLEALDDVLT